MTANLTAVVSGVAPALNLTIENNALVTWLPGGGLSLTSGARLATITRDGLLYAISATLIGILLASVGYHDMFGVMRWTGGSNYLWDGIPLVPFVTGLFAISELIIYTSQGGTTATLTDMRCRETTLTATGHDGPYARFVLPRLAPWESVLLIGDKEK